MPEPPHAKAHPHPIAKPAAGIDPPDRSAAGRSDAPAYVELEVTSNFTFLTGASHPDELVSRSASLGYRAIALTDTNSLAGVVRAHVAAKDAGVRFIVGCRLVLTDAMGVSVLVYPTGREGYGHLCRLLTIGKRRASKGGCDLALEDLAEHHEGLLAVAAPPETPDAPCADVLARLRRTFCDDRLSLALSRAFGPEDEARVAWIAGLSRSARIPLVITNAVHYHAPERRALQDVLTCVRHRCTIEDAGYRLFANAERFLKEPAEMHRLFAAYPRALARTIEIAERTAGFSLDQLRYEYPDEIVPAGSTAQEHLMRLTREGACGRYPGGVPEKVRAQIEHELRLIAELNYAPYFLTVHDLVAFARGKGILCQGRGAAANSAVCYCLGVTSVDPDRVNVLFERFVSKERDEPPDIDIDFEHERREEVIQYIYAKYGRDRAALTAEVISFRGRLAIREVGKAMGLSKDCIDLLAREVSWWDTQTTKPELLRSLGLNPDDPHLVLTLRLANELMGFPRHLSQHVGGFVITRTPLDQLVPIENAAMPDRTVIEWDKDDIEALGMLKVDVLGLGMLSAMRKCLDFVNEGLRGTKGQRDKGTKGRNHSSEGDTNERSPHVPRLVGVAEEQIACETGVHDDEKDATGGDVWIDLADAAGRGVDPIQHRGGICQADATGVHARAEDCKRLTCGTRNAVGDRDGVGDTRDPSGFSPALPRTGSHAQCFDDEADPQALRRQPPLSLCPSVPLSLSTIPPEDPAVYDMICAADTVGVFQIESRAQMSMLPRLRPRCYYDLVIEVAIVRPGPIQGKMVHPYLRRRAGEEPITFFDDTIKRVLGRTLGVPLFQEQAMSLAVEAAGFTPGEADQLRRAIGAWKTRGNKLALFGERIMAGMVSRGYPPQFAANVFEQIKGFSGYGFPESHAASFALLVYASSWLKKHHPGAFAAALINSQPMGFYQPAQIVRDAREHGVEIRPIDVNHSTWDCTLEPSGHGPAIRLGMRLVKGLAQAEADRVAEAVARNGPARSIARLWRESGVKTSTLRRLAAADAFGSMGLTRQTALWAIQPLRDEALPLFETGAGDGCTAERAEQPEYLPAPAPEGQVAKDYAVTGLSLRHHPVSFARDRLSAAGVLPNSALTEERAAPDKRAVRVAGLVLVRQRPGTASGVVFMTIEDETGIANLVVWPKVYEQFRAIVRHSTAVVCAGTVQRAGSVVHVVARRFKPLSLDALDGMSMSRDFH